MITFKQYLEESRAAPLYHGTSIMNVRSILMGNSLISNTVHYDNTKMFKDKHLSKLDVFHFKDKGVKGVSLTRSFRTARQFGPVVFELDQQKLIQKYKIYPVNFWNLEYSTTMGDSTGVARQPDNSNNEYEEFLVGVIKPLDHYITAIWVNEDIIPSSIKDHPKLRTYPGDQRINPRLSSTLRRKV